jgi:hypothetical protein
MACSSAWTALAFSRRLSNARSVRPTPERYIAVRGVRPAEIGEEPPIVAVVPGVALAQIDTGLIVISHAREGEQAEPAERQQHDYSVPRPAVKMSKRALERLRRMAFNEER